MAGLPDATAAVTPPAELLRAERVRVVIGGDLDDEAIARSYEVYRRHLAPLDAENLCRQSLDRESFARVLAHAATTSLWFESGPGVIALPALVPVAAHPWLSAEFYAGRFADAWRRDAVVSFSLGPGLTGYPPVRAALTEPVRDLGARRAVVAVDHPSGLDERREEVRGVLDDAGVAWEETGLLGTQTGFAGPVRFRDPSRVRPRPAPLLDAFEAAREEGELVIDLRDGPAVVATMDDDEIERWWQIYEASFADAQRRSPCLQTFARDEFTLMMRSRDVAKFVYRAEGEAVTLCLLSTRLDLCPWVSVDYFETSYPGAVGAGRVMYCPGLFTAPGSRGEHYASDVFLLVEEVTVGAGNECVATFDCSDEMRDIVPPLFEAALEAGGLATVTMHEASVQEYHAFALHPRG